MAIADDLDRATDSAWDWVADQTKTYLASGGTEGHESNGVYTLVLFNARARVATATERERLWPVMVRIFPLYEDYAQKTDRVIPIVLLTPQD